MFVYSKIFNLLGQYLGSAKNFVDSKNSYTSTGNIYDKKECFSDYVPSSMSPVIVLLKGVIVNYSRENSETPNVHSHHNTCVETDACP